MDHTDRVSQRLKLRDLHCLLTVAQAGSLSKAARSLGVSQPVLSKTIADLELLIGVRLLDRGPRGVEVTAKGRHLLAASHAIFDELRLGVEEIEHLADPAAGALSLGGNEASMIGIIPAAIKRIRREHPRVAIQVALVNTAAEQRLALRERRIDFAIGRIAVDGDDEEFASHVLFNQRQVIVAGKANPWAHKAGVALADLLGEPWVLPSIETASGQLAANVFHLSGLKPPRAAVVTSSFLLNRGLLERGPFLALMPESILPLFLKGASLRRVDVALPRQLGPVGIVKLRHRAPSPLAGRFVEIAQEIAREMRGTLDAPS